LARRLIERTRIYKALQGVRGQGPIAFDQLETLLVRFSYLLCDFLEIQEIDINPLLAGPEGIVALDARVLLAPADLPEDKKPRLTIEPYPNQYTSTFTPEDGKPVTIRAIRPEDEPLIETLHSTLTEQTIRLRFFSMVKTLSRESLIRLCHLDYAREMALVAERTDEGGKPYLLGVSRYYMNPETRTAEYAIVVSDRYQGKGLGQHLMQKLIEVARQRGVKTLIGLVLRDNAAMLGLCKELGFQIPADAGEEALRVTLDLNRAPAP
jgi:acetyltransferase